MNPLLNAYTSPFEIPPFGSISTGHFKPALEEGMKMQNELVKQIILSADTPTFENTIVALEHSGHLLQRVKNVFFNFTLALTDESLQEIAKEMAPTLSRHWDEIKLNDKLYERVRHVWEQREELHLDREQQMLLKNTYNLFFKNGAALGDGDKKKLMQLNESLSQLTLKFGRNILTENNSYQLIIDNPDDLRGLPESLVHQARQTAITEGMEEKWMFTLQWSSVMPFLQYAESRTLRKQIWEAYQNRGNNDNEDDNKEVLKEIVNLRKQKAQIVGYPNHAALVLEDSMAGSTGEVQNLLEQLWSPSIARAKAESKALQNYIDEQGLDFKLAAWDWRYVADKLRVKQGLDMQELLPFFSLEKVIDGVFMVAGRLYGLQFLPLSNVPLYHPDVMAYEVVEKDNKHVGLLFMDFFARKSKQGGAWMTKFRSQSKEGNKRIAPIISIVCNYSKPSDHRPCLLDLDEVATLFHEFGHALHGLLSDVTYPSLAGTAVPRDFVELPSQIMENWAMEPSVMKEYARHYQTGEPISDEMLTKIKNNGKFDQGFSNTEYLAAAFLDLAYHRMEEDLEGDVNRFEKEYLADLGLMEEIIPRYRSTYFNHVFSGGYAASYYSYIWSAVLDSDAYELFKTTGLFDQEMAGLFRHHILEKGGSEEPEKMYHDFKGAGPEIAALLKKRGLDS